MADTAIAITAGSGTNVDTRTEGTNGNHRQVVVLGDPATNAGVAPVDATAGLKVNLGGDNDVTVTSGTIDLGATDNAVLDAISASNAAIQTAVEGTLTVGSHAVTNAGTFATQVDGAALTALQLIDDPVATISATPLMRVAIFDSSDSQITSFGGGTQYAEDAAHSSGNIGTMALAVQQTADGALAGTTGDYAPLQVDENGYLKVNIKSGAGSGGTSATDDGAFTAGVGTGTPAMGFFSTDTVDSGDVGVLAMDAIL